MKQSTNVKSINNSQPLFFLPLVAIILCVIAKLFLCSVSIDGGKIFCDMTADYWNFGKDILQEKLLYSDLMDHKGPYLFFIYSFFVFISSNNIWIMILFETLVYVLTIFSFYLYAKDIKNENGNPNKFAMSQTFAFSLIYLLVTSNVSLINNEGLSAICFILIWRMLNKTNKVTSKMFLIIGIVLGILFNFKFTSIATYFPLFAYACINHIKNNKEYKNLLKSIGMGIVGFITINIPAFIYIIVNNNLDDFIKIYKYTCDNITKTLTIQIIISLTFFISSIFYLIDKKINYSKLMICLSSLMFTLCFGNVSDYYVAICTVILFSGILLIRETKKIITSLLIFSLFVYGIFCVKYRINIKPLKCTKEFAVEFSITNQNILYLWEDVGFGVYSDDTFVEPYQWVPSRMFSSDEFTEYYINLTIERIKNKQFEYIYCPPLALIENSKNISKKSSIKYKDNMQKMFVEVLPYLKEYYTDDLIDGKYLYKAK